ncbi:F-box protein At3g54460 isoform X1 [Punica granatum]|uniref:F-box protein At3g54460 isoform X1 n=3 Tax=Punica granatum TaxID=22663 RepID=A0A6P8BS71_PUNGR|nr:F-box protein At3g54460 isoform X1 [Punica granatum]
MEEEDSVSVRKLCGFLCAVVAVPSPPPPDGRAREVLAHNTRCFIFGKGDEVGFRTEDGVVLSPVDNNALSNPVAAGDVSGSHSDQKGGTFSPPKAETSVSARISLEGSNAGGSGEVSTPANSVKCDYASRKGRGASSSKGKARRIGLVNGSMSVIHQLNALVAHKCLNIVARVLCVEERGCGESRAAVLVDVYLPVDVWSGWQFPQSKAVAGSLFYHLSCNWEERAALLAGGENYKGPHGDGRSLWNVSDCHVLGCKQHSVAMGSSKKKLFDLHEIFKSLPGIGRRGTVYSSRVDPIDNTYGSGIWDLSDDVLTKILTDLGPLDLIRIAATCRHLRSLAVSIMPCMKLKLFPHQQAAVEWMLQREQSSEVLWHPLYKEFVTEDGFTFCVNVVSGELTSGMAPKVKDFHGGLFCDEPGLGKTITALSLILKTQGKLADLPDGEQVIWCTHNGNQKCGYYELSGDNVASLSVLSGREAASQNAWREEISRDNILTDHSPYPSPKRARLMAPDEQMGGSNVSTSGERITLATSAQPGANKVPITCTRSLNHIKKNLLHAYEDEFEPFEEKNVGKDFLQREHAVKGTPSGSRKKQSIISSGSSYSCRRPGGVTADSLNYNETWIQCEACQKWRRLIGENSPDINVAWFCSMNVDPMYQSCSVPEECWDTRQPITKLPGFCPKGSLGAKEQNVAFFVNALKDHCTLITSQTKKALHWLAKLRPDQLSQMETTGLRSPCTVSVVDANDFHEIFQSFGLVKSVEKGNHKWYYPKNLQNLAFDVASLRIALSEPLNSVRLYLSRATLIVVPANLVDHWKTQIQRHVRLSQLRVHALTNRKKVAPHTLAWDYDIVITTFTRLSAEWAPRKKSVLQQVHWLRIILDEGHTLGSSLSLTNKLQMAISLAASSRWILTGTPTPNTPNSELSHLQILFRFLHEEVYGQIQKSWEAGILRPFEAEMEEGRARLLDLLHRCMISARKKDLQAIPPCIKKATLLDFMEEHAKSYNELVATVRRNILMADWNDPSHVESLLNRKQWKFRSTTIRNVRLSCCVAGHIKVTEAGEDIQETMDILSMQGLDAASEEYALIKYYLLYGGTCVRCKQWCRLPVITPCRHLLCLDCVALDREKCMFAGCGYSYEMQTPEARPDNPNPMWPVPKDLIELQPSYKQDDWDPDWQSTSSSKVAYLVQRLKEFNGANENKSNENYGVFLSEERLYPALLNNSRPLLATGFDRIMTEKVIIFSQFLEHIHVIEQQLTIAGIRFAGMYSPMPAANKVKSLATFQHDPTCMALLMDGSAALGLDLSFVSHVFLMEPIWDKSMEEQVISRAHRMGAARPIHVETLAMRGTIEQQMLELLQDDDSCRRFLKEEVGRSDHERTRAHRSLHDFAGSNYLSHLKCVPTKVDI